MYKVSFSYMLAERFGQDPLEIYFCKRDPPGAWKDNLPFYGYAKCFWNQKVFKPVTTGNVRDENIKFQSEPV